MSTPLELRVLPDSEEMSRVAAAAFVEAAVRAVAERGRFTVAVSGGTTPRETYAMLAVGLRRAVPWHAVHLYYADERCVEPDHPASNHAMVREVLLAHVPILAPQVHRIAGERGPALAAAAYDAELRAAFGEPGAARARTARTFDLALLGVGEDGHTASLFPGSAALDVTDRWAVGVESADPQRPWPRVTLTLPALCAAETVLVLAAGAGKRRVVRGVASDAPDVRTLPAARVRGREHTLWLVDEAAGADVEHAVG